MTYHDIANGISNIRWRIKDDAIIGVIDFEYNGRQYTIAEPMDVLLADNEPTKKWIAVNYGWLLA